MRAVGYYESRPLTDPQALVDLELPDPEPGENDLLVEVRAISVNPVDAKVRQRMAPEHGEAKVLGWDAAGIVLKVGNSVSGFSEGDEVFYAGDMTRQGTNAEKHIVDARIVGRKPKSLDFAEAAAMPLTAITAWEALFDRLAVDPEETGSILIIGGAGGVGSMAIQLLRQRTALTVVTTASRPQSLEWVRDLGAHYVLDHSQSLAQQFRDLGLSAPRYVFSTTHSDQHLSSVAELMQPQGRFALIDDPDTLDISVFKRKSISVHWEFMFTRSMFHTEDIAKQQELLDEVARLVDAGKIKTTLSEVLGPISAENLIKAHRQIESGHTHGKIVLTGY